MEDYDAGMEQRLVVQPESTPATAAISREILLWKSKVQRELHKLYSTEWSYLPKPRLGNIQIPPLNLLDVYDFCQLVSVAFELAHTGLNGLRYENHIFPKPKLL
jgi:hypothetical protein